MIGKTVSHYKIISKLGEGGMGVVYKAEDARLDRHVAIKFLPSSLATQDAAKRRFVQEAKAASSLEHPNICTVHDIGETDDGQMFIAMPHYDGETLQERVARGPLEIGDALDIVTQLASGLAKAHEKGIVHRDIKPGNIFITADGHVKILDFGLAKLATETRLTRSGTTLGTIAYMSPEQASGRDVDTRSDIFSLGAVFYEMLTGQLPFRGDHEAAIIYGIMHNDPEPVHDRCADAPQGLQRVIDKLLAKDADARYQSVNEFGRDLVEFGGRDSGFAGTVPRGGILRPRWQLFAGLAGIVVIVGLVVSLWPRFWEPGTAEGVTLAVVDFNNVTASADSTRTVAVAGLIHVGLVENSPCRVVSPSYLMELRRRLFGAQRGRIEDSQALEVARESGATMLLSGQMGEIDEQPYVAWQLVDTKSGQSVAASRAEGSGVAALADEILGRVLPVLADRCGTEIAVPVQSVTELTTASPEAYELYVVAVGEGETMIPRERMELLEKAVALDSTFAMAHMTLARMYRDYRSLTAARQSTELAWRWRSKLTIQGRMLLDAWRDELDFRVVEAIEVYRELHDRWPDDKVILKRLSHALWTWRYFRDCLEITRRGLVLYPDDPGFLFDHQALLNYLDQPDEALDAARTLVKHHPENPNHWDELAMRFVGAGYSDSAEVAIQKALELKPDWKYPLFRLADLLYYRGDLEGAIREHERLHETYSWRGWLAFQYREAGRYDDAVNLMSGARRTPDDPADRLRGEIPWNRFLLTVGREEDVLRWTDSVNDEIVPLGEATDNTQLLRLVRRNVPGIRARALVALDSLEAARTLSSEIQSMVPEFGNSFRIQALDIDAGIALKTGDPDAALAAIDQLRWEGVSGDVGGGTEIPTMRAEAYRMSGRLDEAAAVHQQLLRIYGGHALSHYHLGVIYQDMDRRADAKRELTRFLEMWSDADEGLPQLVDARDRLEKLEGI